MTPLIHDDVLLLGIDGGGTRCRARLTDWQGRILGQATAGPANIRYGLQESLAAVIAVTRQCLNEAALPEVHERIVACLALAGACEPATLLRAQAVRLPFGRAHLTSDARAACTGAHGGQDGAIVIVGTGSIGWGLVAGRKVRAGGWGFPLSDAGSGAWLGSNALAQVLHAYDGLRPWTDFLRALFHRFEVDAYAIVRWMRTAKPRDYAAIAPLIASHAEQGDAAALELMRSAAFHIDALAVRMLQFGAPRLSLLGGFSDSIKPYLPEHTRQQLISPMGDALSGALAIARTEAHYLFSGALSTHG
jgi:glucosamine kinase